MAKRIARKVKRAGKAAVQFRFTSTFEYIDLTCNGTWRPDKLRVIWLRSHRRVQSSEIEFIVTEDRGPNGADGRAVFDPPITVSLVVTLYRDAKRSEFEEKEYKYYIENEGENGKKILSSFNCDMSEYAGIPSSRHALEMNFKPVSRKVSKSLLGITLESEFIKEGKDTDEDMQSTFSAIEPGQSMMYADEDEDIDEDDLDEAATLGMRPVQSPEKTQDPGPQETDVITSIITLGTGMVVKRSDIDRTSPPRKPPRTNSIDNLDDIHQEQIHPHLEKQDVEQDNIVPQHSTDNENAIIENDTKLLREMNNIEVGKVTDLHQEEERQEKPHEEPHEEPQEKPHEEPQEKPQEEPHEEPEEKPHEEPHEEPEEKPHEEPHEEPQEKPHEEPQENEGIAYQKSIDLLEKYDNDAELIPQDVTIDKNNVPQLTTDVPLQEENKTINDYIIEQSADLIMSTEAILSTELTSPEVVSVEPVPPEDVPVIVSNQNQILPTNQPNSDINSQSNGTNMEIHQTETHELTPPQPLPAEWNHSHTNLEPPLEETPPLNPFDPPANPFDNPPPSTSDKISVKTTWLPDVEFVDCNDVPVSTERVDNANVIGLYFSAQWCPPCRRFLPKLTEFYSALKKNDKPFEIIYVSNDNSRTEMIQYMQEQQMPWLAIPHGHPLIDKLKLDFKVRSIPLLVIVSKAGEVLEDNAKKSVEGTHVAASSAVKQYSKWLDKSGVERTDEPEEVKQKTSILGNLKKALTKDSFESPPSPKKGERETAESKVHKSKVDDSFNKDELLRQLQQKEDIIRHLEEVNLSLKHTNDELNTELRTLKSSLEQSQTKVKELEETNAQKKVEDAKFREYLNVQGWLFKKGAKGPTANVFRKRYFRLDQGSKLYYYKSQAEGTPQGYIDLLKIISVSEVTAAQQDKNNASFNIDCEGRTFQLQAHDESEMRRWINAIDYLKSYYKKKEGASR